MTKKNVILALIVSLLYFLAGYGYVSISHFHEDAYIMFRYVEMFTKGYGITYYPGGEPTEGATDFLWFLLLSGLNFLKIDVGIASIILNSIGVFFITYVIVNVIFEITNNTIRILLLPFSFLWLLFIPVLASLGGFSVFLYCGLILLNLHLLNKKIKIVWVPILSIIIALFRPDGVILGVVFTLIGLYMCNLDKRKQYLINMFLATLIGVIYFVWRYNYFGELLPLPLYVKQAQSIMLSLEFNISVFFRETTIAGDIFLFLFLFILQPKEKKKHIALLTIPIIVLFSILSLAHQSQNVAFRFQAPIIYMNYYLIIVMIVAIYNKNKKYFYLCLVGLIALICLSFRITYSKAEYAYLQDRHFYINVFPYKLSKYILEDKEVMALTEAGRLAYWLGDKQVKIIDLVGLNTRYTAKNRLTEDYVEEVNPDVIMAFIGNSFKGTKNVYWMKDKAITKKYFYEKWRKENIANLNSEFVAMEVIDSFLIDHWDEYDIFFVNFGNGWYFHIYAIKKSKNKSELFYKLLEESFNNSKSYLELKKKEHE